MIRKRSYLGTLILSITVGLSGLGLVAVTGCEDDESADESGGSGACRIICESGEKCGGPSASDCMSECTNPSISPECLECYEEDQCSRIGSCLMSCE